MTSIEIDPLAEAFAESFRLGVTVAAEAPSYPVVVNPQVQFFIDRFTGPRRDLVTLWLNRSVRYLGMIRDVLRSRGLPEELGFTAMIESGYNPAAVSRVGAVGLWQFMASTARQYGLRVDRWVDERLDPEKSTLAAASYLRDLYQAFGSWELAQAAYNAGEVKVSRAIRATRSNDFWVLARSTWLRRETQEFVPQIHAATVIAREPARFGFEPAEGATVATETVSVPGSTDLGRLAAASGVPADALRSLNPTLIKGITPPEGPYHLRVPSGSAAGVLAAVSTPLKPTMVRSVSVSSRVARSGDVHVVRSRDTVSSIAKRYNVSVGDVLRWNSLGKQDPIRPGDRLRIADQQRLSIDRDRQAGAR